MLKFNFEKLNKNCIRCREYKEHLADKETLSRILYESKSLNVLQYIKSCCEETDMSLRDVIFYFANDTDFGIDIDKINERMQKITTKCSCKYDGFCPNKNGCAFYGNIDNPFQLGYKDAKTDTNPNAYPFEHFPPLMNNYITQLSDAMVAPPQYVGTALLALFSTLYSRFAYVKATPTWKIPLTGYYLIVGDVSTKKTPTISEVLSLLNGHTAKEDRIFANDSTIEALEQLLSKHKSILLHADESGIMDTLGGYTKTNHASMSKILSLYTCKPYRVDRKGQEPIFIKLPKLSILAGVQPEVLKRSQNLMHTGMLQRFIIAHAERSKEYCGFSMSDVDQKTKQEIIDLVVALYELGEEGNPIVLTLSKQAVKSLKLLNEELFTDIENSGNNAMRDYLGKFKEHVLKIVGLFHIVRQISENIKDNEISDETFDMALQVANYYSNVSSNIFNSIGVSKPIDAEKGYQELLQKSKDGTFNPTFLNAGGIGGCDARNKEYTNSFIQRLIDQNRCIELSRHGGKSRKFILIKE